MAFSRGYQNVDANLQREKERNVNVRRFWLKKGEEKHISFIDDDFVSFPEHSFDINGNWDQIHCIGAENGCPFCLNGKKPYDVTVFTIIDHTQFQTRDGRIFADQKVILAVRPKHAVTLRDLAQSIGGLKTKRIVVRRSTERNAPNSGDSFSLAMHNGQRIVTPWEKFDKAILVPYAYEKLYAPKSIGEMQALFHQHQMSSRQNNGNFQGGFNQSFGGGGGGYDQGFNGGGGNYGSYPPPAQYSQQQQPQQSSQSQHMHEQSSNPADELGADCPF